MAQGVAVVNATLTATGSGTTDFTSSGFGTPSAAIVLVSAANSTNNPQSSAGVSIGFWDGTNQCCHSFVSGDGIETSVTYRIQRNDYIAALSEAGSTTNWVVGYIASAVTDGIRLTLNVDNTGVQRYATVILLKGISAKIARLVLSSTLNGTATTGSLGFAPTAALMLCSGTVGNTPNSGSTQTNNALLSFGAAKSDGTHRMLAWAALHAASTADVTALFSETRVAAQVLSGAESWSADVTTWGADTLTMTSRTAGSGGDDVDMLCLGGADLSLLIGTLTTATATGSADVTTTGIDPAAVLLCLGNTTSTTIASDGTASGFAMGASDGTTHGGYASVDQDASDVINTESAYSSTNALYSRTSASGTASDLVVGALSMGTGKFSVNYTTVSGTARKGWYLTFGQAGGSTITADLTESITSTDSALSTLLAAAAATESITATDAITALLTAVASLTESSSATDAQTAARTQPASLTEAASAADVLTAVAALVGTLTEAASATDLAAAVSLAVAAVSEALGLTDTQSYDPTIFADLSEAASATDAVSAIATLVAELAESASAVDAVTAAGLLVSTLAESVAAADAQTVAAQLVGLLTESVSLADVQSTEPIVLASIEELAAALDLVAAVLVARGVLSAPPIGHGPRLSSRPSNAGSRRPSQLSSRTR